LCAAPLGPANGAPVIVCDRALLLLGNLLARLPIAKASTMRVSEILAGRWRAVPILGLTQIIAWGTLYYPPVLTLPLLAAERGFSLTFAMGGFSVGLLTGGLTAPAIGRLIDRHGGHRVMAGGAIAGALGCVLLVQAAHPLAYL